MAAAGGWARATLQEAKAGVDVAPVRRFLGSENGDDGRSGGGPDGEGADGTAWPRMPARWADLTAVGMGVAGVDANRVRRGEQVRRGEEERVWSGRGYWDPGCRRGWSF